MLVFLNRSYLSALSKDIPVKSKKLRYSEATNWLNSLLQEKENKRIVGVKENNISFPCTYGTQTLTFCPGVGQRHSA